LLLVAHNKKDMFHALDMYISINYLKKKTKKKILSVHGTNRVIGCNVNVLYIKLTRLTDPNIHDQL